MHDATLAVQLFLAFGGGILSFLSPCVLPLLPGYLGLMSGYSVAGLQSGEASTRRMLRVTGLFVLGFTVVFVASGALATRIGQVLGRNQVLSTRIAGALILVFGLVIVGMALTNRGLFGYLARERRVEVRPSRLGAWAPPVMGAAFAFGWSPCIGPILGVVVTTAATRDTVYQGMGLLLAYSLGLGVPFVAAGIGLGRALGAARVLRAHLRSVNVVAGVLMAGFGVVMLTGSLGRLSGVFTDIIIRIPVLRNLVSI